MRHLLVVGLMFGGSLAHAGEKDYTTTPLKEIGVTPVTPKKEKSGFIVGGKNATELIRDLKEINGRKIADLEKDMRPGAVGDVYDKNIERFEGSTSGFIGKDEKLLDVLATDNAFVVDKLGLTHQEMARPLQIATTLGMSKRFEQNGITYIYHGQKYRVKMINYKGYQFSPFYDRTNTSTDATIENLTNGKTLTYSPLVPHMIERYGFYEGKGLRYRVEPSAVLEVFPYLKGKK